MFRVCKNLLDKYKEGKSSLEETKLIKEELNKHEAIEEYLSESYNIGLENDIPQGDINTETNFVGKSVNKKLRKVILTSVVIVFLILFTIFYIVFPISSKVYYNPSQRTVGKYRQDLYYDLKAFTELNLPGYAINTAGTLEKLGFGVYDIYFERVNLFNAEKSNNCAKIKRNMRVGSYLDFAVRHYAVFEGIKLKLPEKDRSDFFEVQNDFFEDRKNEAIGYIKKLNSVSYISSYVILKNDLTMEEFNELREKYNQKIDFKWVGIRTESKDKKIHYLSGFNPGFYDGSRSSINSAYKDKYPYLQLGDWVDDFIKDNNEDDRIQAYTKHYISLLKYVNDRGKAVKALDVDANNSKIKYYKNALNYVEKNGVKTYGVLIYGEAKDLLEFINNEKIKSIQIDSVLPSKYVHYLR